MLKNLFVLIDAAVVMAKAARWCMDYRQLRKETRELKAERRRREQAQAG